MRELAVHPFGFARREPYPVRRVVGEPSVLGQRRAGGRSVPPGPSDLGGGFQAPDAGSAVPSSTASRRCASRPEGRPTSASGSALPGFPARAKAAAVASRSAGAASRAPRATEAVRIPRNGPVLPYAAIPGRARPELQSKPISAGRAQTLRRHRTTQYRPPRSPVRPARHPDAVKNHISLTVSNCVRQHPWETRPLDEFVVHQYRHENPARRLTTWRAIRIMDDHRDAESRKTAVRGGVHGIGAQGECLAWPRRRQQR